ncbi:unnamed protein product [Arctia plantaginis]|uniref:OPA3-like protein n=1 Tax=Arctia plantaginis TaxID=874455 RepID=A0A8S0ZEA0_ARCPL|nr:unnamed protein product [Arctia plantaginis]
MEQFPMFRLATLLARQVSAPIANRIKEYASRHPWFSKHVCMAVGQLHNTAQLRFRMWTLALRQPKAVTPLSDSAALEAGGNILGEIVIFFLGSLIIILEVNRQANNQEDKELNIQSQWMAVLDQLEELQRELRLQQEDIDRLFAELRDFAPHLFPPVPTEPPNLTPKLSLNTPDHAEENKPNTSA